MSTLEVGSHSVHLKHLQDGIYDPKCFYCEASLEDIIERQGDYADSKSFDKEVER